MDVLVDTFCRIWTDLLDVLGIDGRCEGHSFHTAVLVIKGGDILQAHVFWKSNFMKPAEHEGQMN